MSQAIFAGIFSLLIWLAKIMAWKAARNPVLLGTSLVVIVSMSASMVWAANAFTDFVKSLGSLDMVLALNFIPAKWKEDDYSKPTDPDPKSWPSGGKIVANQIFLRYQIDHPFVVQDASFHIKKGDKVLVVGKSGSGKSTLIHALFRIIEYE